LADVAGSSLRDAKSALKPEVFRSSTKISEQKSEVERNIPASVGNGMSGTRRALTSKSRRLHEIFRFQPGGISSITGARALAIFGDSVTIGSHFAAGAIKKMFARWKNIFWKTA